MFSSVHNPIKHNEDVMSVLRVFVPSHIDKVLKLERPLGFKTSDIYMIGYG